MCLQQKMVIIPKSSQKITQLDMGSLFGYIRLEKKFHVLLEKAELTCSQNGYFGVSGHISGVFGLSIGCPNICPEYSEYLGYRLDVRTYVTRSICRGGCPPRPYNRSATNVFPIYSENLFNPKK